MVVQVVHDWYSVYFCVSMTLPFLLAVFAPCLPTTTTSSHPHILWTECRLLLDHGVGQSDWTLPTVIGCEFCCIVIGCSDCIAAESDRSNSFGNLGLVS